MVLIPFAIVAGLFLGLVRRGSLENLLGFRPSLWALAIVGAITLLVGEFGSLSRSISVALFIAGSLLLMVILSRNTRFKGSIIIGLGLGLNLLGVIANGHVPVRYDALVGAGEVASSTPSDAVSLTGLREMEDAGTRLALLGEVVPLELLNAAISFGDLIVAAGVTVFAMHLLLARRRRGIDVEDLLGPEVSLAATPELDLRMKPVVDQEIDLRPSEPKLVPAPSEKAQVFGPGESNFNRPHH